jgi:signal transduction histidine kinase/CheY-like chemotaxis protein
MKVDADIKIIGQLSIAENMLHVFPSREKISDFSTQALKKVPGAARNAICLMGVSQRKGELVKVPCEDCQMSTYVEFSKDLPVCRFAGRQNHKTYHLKTPAQFFGFLIIEIVDPELFSLYAPFISNFSNAISINMENLWQKEQLQIKNTALEAHRHNLESLIKKRTHQLEKSEHLLDITQKMAKIGGWEWDVEKQTMSWTAETYRIHGLDPENHEKCSPENSLKCYDPADQPFIWKTFQQCIKDKTPYDMQFPITTYQNRRVWIRTMGLPVLENDRVTKVIGNIMDISDYKELEAERIALTKQLQHAQKAESLGRMAGAIAHHFNNQLNVVMGNLELTLEDCPKDAAYRGNLVEALQAAHRSSEISGLMLTYLGQDTGKTWKLDLSRLCLTHLPILRNTLPRDITLETDFMSVGPAVLVNDDQMQKVLFHLVTNAAEAIGNNTGRIRLSTRTIPLSDIPAIVTAPVDWQPNANMYACLEVADTGSGIAEKDMEKLFDPFFTTKFTGRGLGLPVILGLVKSWDGAFCVTSKTHHGSCFQILLPVQENMVSSRLESATQNHFAAKRGTVLLVDDQDAVRKIGEVMLKRLEFTPMSAASGPEAVAVFRRHQDRICCVITDLTMPDMDGWETLAALRRIQPDLPVILASGHDQTHAMNREHAEKFQTFLHKPYAMIQLKNALQKALQAGI